MSAYLSHQSPLVVDELHKASSLARSESEYLESQRKLTKPVVDAITASGLTRLFVPKMWGGHEGSFLDYKRALEIVALGSPSASWCAAVFASVNRMMAFLPEEGQEEIWGGGPDVVVVDGIAPTGRALRSGRDWTLSGTWSYVSGVDFCDWVLLGAKDGSADSAEDRFFAVPRSDFEVLDTWQCSGMRGTGSNSVVLHGVTVPARRTFPREDIFSGKQQADASPCYRTPIRAIGGLSFVVPMLGAAKSGLVAWDELMRRKRDRRGPKPEDGSMLTAYARSAAAVDAADLLLERVAVTGDTPMPSSQVLRSARDYSYACELLVGAVEQLVRHGGTGALASGSPLEQIWRDINAAASHTGLQLDMVGPMFARAELAL
ncbi:hypothetical protein [Streptomyces sp. 769]|uniref:hypothetical protein n=1 Tax=Streptomyces sp. 769 TaxID=1262452 RepID=UPI000581F8D9|nr:hypothetical protein [Streptomyces sp. 769]AJC62142.1 oxygenase LndZ5 [Streptomyces sp. 769]